MHCLATPLRQLKRLYSFNADSGMTPLPEWEIWQTPLTGAEIVILSAALQPTSAVGTNMADMKRDSHASGDDDMVHIRLLVPSENKVHTVIFHNVFSFSFRDDSLEAAMMEPDANGVSFEGPSRANHLLRSVVPEYDISDVGLTRWRIQDADTVLEILSDQALPKFTSASWD